MALILVISSIVLSVTSIYIYKKIWYLSQYREKVPTGFGFILVFFLLTASLFHNAYEFYILFSISLLASIYWIDDISHLSFFFRLLLQFACGLLIGIFLIYFMDHNFEKNYLLIILLISGLLNIFLSNVINFYDGLDLNISTFSIILAFTIIFLVNQNASNIVYAFIILGFILGFSFFNIRPNNIFFGDSGCFVIASFINYVFIQSVLNYNFSVIYIIIPLALPILDVFYVLGLRVYLRESLLSRNYYHIYHQLHHMYKNKLYLLPQILNSSLLFFVCFSCSRFFSENLMNLNIFLLFSIFQTIFIYYYFKKIVIKK